MHSDLYYDIDDHDCYDVNCVSIGGFRDDGDFHILATLNNNDKLIGVTDFNVLIRDTYKKLCGVLLSLFEPEEIKILIRQDTPDYVAINDDDELVAQENKRATKSDLTDVDIDTILRNPLPPSTSAVPSDPLPNPPFFEQQLNFGLILANRFKNGAHAQVLDECGSDLKLIVSVMSNLQGETLENFVNLLTKEIFKV